MSAGTSSRPESGILWTMRKSVIAALLTAAGCVNSDYKRDHQKLRELESELVIARGDLRAYREDTAQVSTRVKALGEKADARLERAISITHHLTGDE